MIASGDRSAGWKCGRCNPGGDNEDGDSMREARGCDKDQPMLHLPFAPSSRRCPNSQIPRSTWQHITNWERWHTSKRLPYAGGIGSQPLYLVEGIEEVAKVFEASRRAVHGG